MLKFVVVVWRKPDWTFDKFRDYFIRVHGPLALKIPGLRRYKQNFPAFDSKRKAPGWDSVVELYFDDKGGYGSGMGPLRKEKPQPRTSMSLQICPAQAGRW